MRAQHLIAPRETPDGTISWEEVRPELAARIRDGDGRLGWTGDDRLSLHLNVAYRAEDPEGRPRWEVWRRHDDGTASMVVSKVAARIDGEAADRLIRGLALSDSRGRDIAREQLDARDARDAAARKELADHSEGHADRLAWALGKDLGAPAQSGRPFPVS